MPRGARRADRRGIAARAVAFISPDPAADVTRVAEREDVDLVLIDGRRPLLGEGVPRGEVGASSRRALRRGRPRRQGGPAGRPGADSSVVVPFGGAEHDWAALELGAWIASATGAPLKLLGAAGETEETSKVSRLLADAGLLVQQYAGVPAEPVIAEPGARASSRPPQRAGLLVIGLSRAGARRASARPARRSPGRRPPRSSSSAAEPGRERSRRATTFTRFTWSSPGAGPAALGPAR